ncbi:MAG: hypothetical protein J7I99_06590 [Methanophagales archaeon]|nr:hypothetical protein [Methanophagales archaeon]
MRAVALLSGGLDSILALKLILEQGIEVVALNLILPFLSEKGDYAGATAWRFGIPLVRVEACEEYLAILRSPKYGYGSAMNPCIDCHIYMLRKAKAVAEQVDASFIVTGDVLGERPMSQHRRALELEDKEACVEGKVLRPLSARLLPETIPERAGWIDRSKLLAIRGKSRKTQIALAKRYNLGGAYPTPSGGCLLTCREFASRVRDILMHNKDRALTMKEVELLKVGRHFRFGASRIIVGRNERENEVLKQLRDADDYLFEVRGCGSPITILKGSKSREAVELAAKLTVRYSDADADADTEAVVEYWAGDEMRKMAVPPLKDSDSVIARFRI